MKMTYLTTIAVTLGVMVIFVGILSLIQFLLSKTESKLPGLVIPGISFLMSLIVGVGRLIYDFQTSFIVILGDIFLFAVMNIPTVIFMVIYIACRKSKAKKDKITKEMAERDAENEIYHEVKNEEIDKMNINDL